MSDRLHTVADVPANQITLKLLDGDKSPASTKISADEAGYYAAKLLEAAQFVFELSGRTPPNVGSTIEMPAIIAANSVRSAQIPGSGKTTLIFHFGEAVIGIAIPQQSLMPLGQELCAASVPTGGKPQ